ncbi:MAG: SulP family inorganic anion transporter [Actinobacteria bacterium]|nr:SulP family inorganic anion transporter [Actinomycetota bacterium]
MKVSAADLRNDAIAGLPGAISSVPDGMAAAILAGVSPIQGLYASFAGPTAGGVLSSTRLMVITTTSAAALAAGSALSGLGLEERNRAIILLTVIAGGLMVAAGVFKLGRYTRFVTQSVMIGFLSGVAANIVFGQLQDLTGVSPGSGIALARAWRVITSPGDFHIPSLLIGLAAIALLVVLARTPLSSVSAVIALVIPTAVVLLADLEGVAQVSDVGAIPSGIPMPALPRLGDLSLSVLLGALAVAAIVLVQGAGVSESAPNLDGSPSDPNRDFIAQGAGNVAAGLFKGMPVGGSVGQTALNVAAGGRTRWAAVFSGLWMLLILAVFSSAVGKVAVPTLAAVLIVAAIGSLRPREAAAVWRTGLNSKIAMASTFVATLMLPVAAAVGVGVVLSMLLQLNREAIDLAVVEIYFDDDGRPAERHAPKVLRSHEVTILAVYGSLFYAGARTLQARLPDPTGTEGPAVVLRLRGRTSMGATFYAVLEQYSERLQAVGGTLTLTGLTAPVLDQIRRTQRFEVEGPITLVPATERLFESTEKGYRSAVAWQLSNRRSTD